MPKIEVQDRFLYELLGTELTDEQLENIFPVAKAELDGHDLDEHVLKIELNDTNRPDLWSAAGVVRQLRAYRDNILPFYDFFSTEEETCDSEGRRLIIHESAKMVRPYSIGFAATGKIVDETILLNLIQSQEKICNNYGRKRKTIALGVYRSDLIAYPVHFEGADPDKAHFVPLHMEEDLTLRQICERHPKGLEYGHIVADKPVFPFLYDNNNDVLSFPPVINSARIGAVEVGDENLFFEFSGTELDTLLLSAAILACDCADMGFTILPVRCEFSEETAYGKEITVPFYFQKPVACELSYVKKMLGVDLSGEQVVSALKNMGVYSVVDETSVYITVPEYRNDYLHPVDIVEDVMIGYGLERFEPEMPNDSTVGRITDIEAFARKVKDLMVGLGFQEMMYNYLGSKREYIDNMHVDGKNYIKIANPMSENYEYVRPSIIPSLLESESVSGYATYPHQIFEVGKVAFLDDTDDSGTTTRNYLGFMASASDMGFNQLNSMISTLFYFLNKEYTMVELIDPRFIEGRSGKLIVNQTPVGVFGEVHPAVLESWGCSMPTIACEVDLDLLNQ
ncbi:MAG: phenylalanine--tRNA ligase subunit beta [Sphaerochaetaceae bacterium]|jgi:phenylalanyl-tRNA synthetase beta chain|nr:phenylalanine--tRNA ligase subunit beta [Sphaerochaetaceae bacterium]MDD4259566.1 phenylalanine--tRNA ligase subunit beta [Sphaerochaetaceae bacterium]MDD5075624.1 phenylalanine--tRNA ligase subunit beta [Sphaerochaetaceae bacterium]MDX9934812.1 phenylalanine--tRNA ligase subunit beta [Sphaerochaetaceae bacterium]NLO60444.1 phenylalanine--tRNA ligase subunit beta [Spirochaetales bacterium]